MRFHICVVFRSYYGAHSSHGSYSRSSRKAIPSEARPSVCRIGTWVPFSLSSLKVAAFDAVLTRELGNNYGPCADCCSPEYRLGPSMRRAIHSDVLSRYVPGGCAAREPIHYSGASVTVLPPPFWAWGAGVALLPGFVGDFHARRFLLFGRKSESARLEDGPRSLCLLAEFKTNVEARISWAQKCATGWGSRTLWERPDNLRCLFPGRHGSVMVRLSPLASAASFSGARLCSASSSKIKSTRTPTRCSGRKDVLLHEGRRSVACRPATHRGGTWAGDSAKLSDAIRLTRRCTVCRLAGQFYCRHVTRAAGRGGNVSLTRDKIIYLDGAAVCRDHVL